MFARYIDMVERPTDCVKHALARIKNDERGVHVEYKEIHNRRFAAWEKLLVQVPELEQELAECTVQRAAVIRKSLDKGHSQARSDSITTLKNVVYKWIDHLGIVPEKTMAPSLADKQALGFSNLTTAMLLCPCKLDINKEGVREGLESNSIKKGSLPLVFFLDQKFDATSLDTLGGLLRGILLLWTYRHIFTSPSSARSGKSATARKSNSEIAGYKAVTYESIAYAGTILRFLLSSSRSFNMRDPEYDYGKDCYDHIVRVLKRECEPRADGTISAAGEGLLNFWNLCVHHHLFIVYCRLSTVALSDRILSNLMETR